MIKSSEKHKNSLETHLFYKKVQSVPFSRALFLLFFLLHQLCQPLRVIISQERSDVRGDTQSNEHHTQSKLKSEQFLPERIHSERNTNPTHLNSFSFFSFLSPSRASDRGASGAVVVMVAAESSCSLSPSDSPVATLPSFLVVALDGSYEAEAGLVTSVKTSRVNISGEGSLGGSVGSGTSTVVDEASEVKEASDGSSVVFSVGSEISPSTVVVECSVDVASTVVRSEEVVEFAVLVISADVESTEVLCAAELLVVF